MTHRHHNNHNPKKPKSHRDRPNSFKHRSTISNSNSNPNPKAKIYNVNGPRSAKQRLLKTYLSPMYDNRVTYNNCIQSQCVDVESVKLQWVII